LNNTTHLQARSHEFNKNSFLLVIVARNAIGMSPVTDSTFTLYIICSRDFIADRRSICSRQVETPPTMQFFGDLVCVASASRADWPVNRLALSFVILSYWWPCRLPVSAAEAERLDWASAHLCAFYFQPLTHIISNKLRFICLWFCLL